MTQLEQKLQTVLNAWKEADKPLAVYLAGHNGSGKSTMWRDSLAEKFQFPLINADRMMMSILPEVPSSGPLPQWAKNLRDADEAWMRVAQKSVDGFVANAMAAKVPFAVETVFSHWEERNGIYYSSKIERIEELQSAGYFVLLIFVGLQNVDLSVLRVSTRVAENGHDVDNEKLNTRFPRTQAAIKHALSVADASILVDNSRTKLEAFTPCQVQVDKVPIFDVRDENGAPQIILDWLNIVTPKQ